MPRDETKEEIREELEHNISKIFNFQNGRLLDSTRKVDSLRNTQRYGNIHKWELKILYDVIAKEYINIKNLIKTVYNNEEIRNFLESHLNDLKYSLNQLFSLLSRKGVYNLHE